jgi:hypothetical protein
MIRGPLRWALGHSLMIRRFLPERVQLARRARVAVDRRIAISAVRCTTSANGSGARTSAASSENKEADNCGDRDEPDCDAYADTCADGGGVARGRVGAVG